MAPALRHRQTTLFTGINPERASDWGWTTWIAPVRLAALYPLSVVKDVHAVTSTGSPNSVLVLGSEHPRAAAVIRSLARDGIAVDVGDHVQPPTALWRGSRYIRERRMLSEDADAVVAELLETGRQTGGVLIPTNDHYLMICSRHHAALSSVFSMSVPQWNVLEPLMDKISARAIAEDAGLEAPCQFQPQSEAELDFELAKLDFAEQAYVLKIRLWDSGAADPRTLRRVAQGGSDRQTLRTRCVEIKDRTGVFPVVEEVVPGGADCCIGVSMVVGNDHEPLLAYCVRRRKLQLYSIGAFKHPYELGANAYCESVIDLEAIDLATRFVRHARYTGAITVELKRNPLDHRLKFIKADCRVVRATGLSTALGMDIPRALYDVACNRKAQTTRPTEYKAGVKWLWFEAYAYSLWKNRANISLIREFWSLAMRLPRVSTWAYFDIRDPLPSVLLALTARRRLKLLQNPGARLASHPGRMERAVSG